MLQLDLFQPDDVSRGQVVPFLLRGTTELAEFLQQAILHGSPKVGENCGLMCQLRGCIQSPLKRLAWMSSVEEYRGAGCSFGYMHDLGREQAERLLDLASRLNPGLRRAQCARSLSSSALLNPDKPLDGALRIVSRGALAILALLGVLTLLNVIPHH